MLKKQPSKNKLQQNLKIFNNQYLVKKKISAGSFGVVFLGEDNKTNSQIAMKVERNQNGEMKSLDRESHILSRLQGIQGIPKMYWNGTENQYNILVMQLLGKDLAHYVKTFKKLNLKSVVMVGIQSISILEQVHNRSVVHRDIKPENMLVGGTDTTITQVFIVDFGISKFYKDTKGNHIPYKEGKPFIGTTRYASIGAHNGVELGRMDDLESLGYILVYLFKGQLPWQNLQNVSDKDKTKAVGEIKKKIDLKTFSELCKDMPLEFVRYFEYVKKLHFKAQPDYRYLQQLLEKVAEHNSITVDNQFEWIEYEQKSTQKQKLLAPKQQEEVCNTPKSNNNFSQRNLGNGSQGDRLMYGQAIRLPEASRQEAERQQEEVHRVAGQLAVLQHHLPVQRGQQLPGQHALVHREHQQLRRRVRQARRGFRRREQPQAQVHETPEDFSQSVTEVVSELQIHEAIRMILTTSYSVFFFIHLQQITMNISENNEIIRRVQESLHKYRYQNDRDKFVKPLPNKKYDIILTRDHQLKSLEQYADRINSLFGKTPAKTRNLSVQNRSNKELIPPQKLNSSTYLSKKEIESEKQAKKKSSIPSNKFSIVTYLGKGRFADVFKAKDNVNRKTVALKIVQKSIINRHQIEHLIRQEISILKKVQHPNIIQLYSVTEDNQKVGLALNNFPYQSDYHGLGGVRVQLDAGQAKVQLHPGAVPAVLVLDRLRTALLAPELHYPS